MFDDFAEMAMPALVIVLIIIAVGLVGYLVYRKKTNGGREITSKSQWTTKEITTAALCIGASFLLSFIKLFSMPNGGSITPASMLPMIAFSYIYGFKKGFIAGLCYGVLQFVQEPFFLSFPQFALDYLASFSLLALAGFARKNIIPGILYGCGARFVCQFLSGWIFFGMYAPEGMPAWLYSLGYNGTVVGVECAICIAVSLIPALRHFFDRTKAQAVAQQKVWKAARSAA
ncbi:MAG: energy-coupled thiamine transporter ThiT [Christensenella sp.]|nr:energy-coupled thiamine transporter ThiT [Christensenella sp.]